MSELERRPRGMSGPGRAESVTAEPPVPGARGGAYAGKVVCPHEGPGAAARPPDLAGPGARGRAEAGGPPSGAPPSSPPPRRWRSSNAIAQGRRAAEINAENERIAARLRAIRREPPSDWQVLRRPQGSARGETRQTADEAYACSVLVKEVGRRPTPP